MIKPWRAACVQMCSETAQAGADRSAAWEIIGRNLARAVDAVERLCAEPDPPALIVLPEFAFQGPPYRETVAQWIDKACCPIPGPITAPLQALAQRYRIYLGGNQFEHDPQWPGRFFNCCFLIDPAGEVILRYRRINTAVWPSPHDFLDAYLARHGVEGTFPVVSTPLGNLAMIPCGEISVPEVSRALMLRGAEVLLHPTNEANGPAQEAAKIARAAENMMYVVSANVAGPIGFSADGTVLGGHSQVVDFRGRRLDYEPEPHETIAVGAQIDIAALRGARRDLGMTNVLLRQRYEIYQPVFSAAHIYPANQFLDHPMANGAAELPAIAAAALANLERQGIVAAEPVPADRAA
jgi:predicted amidohydrolase